MSDEKDDWRVSAACKTSWGGQVNFFPRTQHGGRNLTEGEMAAKRVCETCKVRDQCLDHALQNREELGVWGGMSEGERRRELNARRKAERLERRNAS